MTTFDGSQFATPIDWVDAILTPLLRRHRFRYGSEADLQKGLCAVLAEGNCVFDREVVLADKTERIDFVVRLWLNRLVGIEVKTAGSFSDVARQLHRYAHSGKLEGLVLVTTRSLHDRLPSQLGAVAVRVHVLGGLRA